MNTIEGQHISNRPPEGWKEYLEQMRAGPQTRTVDIVNWHNGGDLFRYCGLDLNCPVKVTYVQIAKASNHGSGRMLISAYGNSTAEHDFYDLVCRSLKEFGVTGVYDGRMMMFDVAFSQDKSFVSTVMDIAIRLLWATDTADSNWVMRSRIAQITQTLHLHNWNTWQEMRWADPERLILAERGFLSLSDALTGSMFVRGLDYRHIPN